MAVPYDALLSRAASPQADEPDPAPQVQPVRGQAAGHGAGAELVHQGALRGQARAAQEGARNHTQVGPREREEGGEQSRGLMCGWGGA